MELRGRTRGICFRRAVVASGPPGIPRGPRGRAFLFLSGRDRAGRGGRGPQGGPLKALRGGHREGVAGVAQAGPSGCLSPWPLAGPYSLWPRLRASAGLSSPDRKSNGQCGTRGVPSPALYLQRALDQVSADHHPAPSCCLWQHFSELTATRDSCATPRPSRRRLETRGGALSVGAACRNHKGFSV